MGEIADSIVLAHWHKGNLIHRDKAILAEQRKGMEKALSHVMAAMRALKALHPHATSGEIMALGGVAVAIQTDMEVK